MRKHLPTASPFHSSLPPGCRHFPAGASHLRARRQRSRLALGLPALALLALTACSVAPAPRAPQAAKRVLWPLPPQPPRLEFIGLYSSEQDLTPAVERHPLLDQLIGKSTEGTFKRPFGIVPAGPGTVLVADQMAGRIFRIDFRNRTTTPFAGKYGLRPLGLARAADGTVYVADSLRKSVLVFSAAGEYLRRIGDPTNLTNPSFLAYDDRLQRLYVADGPSHRVVVFARSGEHLFDIGGPGAAPGRFAVPQGMAIDGRGHLFVADMLHARIQVFDAEGQFLSAFGVQGLEPWQFENPRDLALAADGTLYILDYRKALLLAYRPNGEFLFALGGQARTSHPLGFSTPVSLAIDETGRIFIVDQLNARLSIWQTLDPEYLAGHPLQEADLSRLQQLAGDFRRQQQAAP